MYGMCHRGYSPWLTEERNHALRVVVLEVGDCLAQQRNDQPLKHTHREREIEKERKKHWRVGGKPFVRGGDYRVLCLEFLSLQCADVSQSLLLV